VTVAQLVTKPAVAAEAKQDAAKIIAGLQHMCDTGDIEEIVTLVKHPDGSWSTHHSASLNRPLMIGYMELAKQSMAKKYLESD
jgi:hypothetical protein